MQHTHTIIIGAGISGLSAARLLTAKGLECIVLEKSDKPGGLVKCDVIDGHLFHRVGGHVFNTKEEKVSQWFWSQFNRDTEFLSARRKAGILLNDAFLGYPFENYLYMLDEATIRKVTSELLAIAGKEKKDPFSYSHFEAFLKGNFGETLYQLYFKPYNHKIWKTDLNQVALPWLEGKLPMPDSSEILISNILRKEETNMVHSSFFYPVQNGSQFIADRLATDLKVVTNTPAKTIEFRDSKWIVNNQFSAENIVYTGDVRILTQLLSDNSPVDRSLLNDATGLISNGTSNLLCETDDMPYSWLYVPEAKLPAHRIIYTGNFSSNNSPTGKCKSCTIEFSGKTSVEDMKNALSKFPGNLKMIDFNYEPNSYVIQRHGDREMIGKLRNELASSRFYLSGRFAEWEYYNMDKAMERAMQVVDAITMNPATK
jgi:protoporphyrinogen oxidase